MQRASGWVVAAVLASCWRLAAQQDEPAGPTATATATPAEAVPAEAVPAEATPAEPTPAPLTSLPVRRILVNGAELSYIEAGSGEPVVLVHGEVSDLRSWTGEMDSFSRRFRVIAYSRRYHYPNKGGGDGLDYSYELHARDLLGFIQALNLGPVHLVGHSYGAVVALLAARQRPDRVRSLVLAEPAPLPAFFAGTPEAVAVAESTEKALQNVRSALGVGDTKRGVRALLDPALGPGGYDRLPPSARAMSEENGTALLYQAIAIPPPVRLECADLKKLAIPTLLVDAELSPSVHRAVHDTLQSCLPSTERLQVMGVGHGQMLERADSWNVAVLPFLEKQRSAVVAVVATPVPTPAPELTSVTVNGVKLAVKDTGSGEPLVLVHGELGDYRVWSDIAAVLSTRYHVIAYSRRNHYPGRPPAVGEDSLGQHQRDLRALVETLGLGPVHLVGHGDGGAIAALLAESNPELVRSLVLVEPLLKRSPQLGTPAGREVSFRSAELATALEAGWRRGGEALAVRAWVDAVSGEGTYEKLPADVKAQLLDNALTLKLKPGPPADFTCTEAARLQRPALLVRGEKSPRLYAAIMDALEACWTGAARLAIPGATHRAPFEAPAVFSDAVLRFLEKTAAR